MLKRVTIDWNYWIIRFIFLMVVIIGFKAISNYQLFLNGLKHLLSVLSPFILGFILAYLLNGAQEKLEHLLNKINLPFIQKKSRGFSVLLLYVVGLTFIFLILNYVVPLILTNIMDLVALLPTFYNYLIELAMKLEENGTVKMMELDELITTFTASYSPDKILSQWTSAISSLGILTKNLSSFVLNTFLSLVISIYALLFKDSLLTFIASFFQKIMPEKLYTTSKHWLKTTNKIFYKFISCQFLDACIIGVSATVLLSLLGVKFALTLGILLGICNMIPYFGSIFASVLTAIITFFTGGLSLAITTIIVLLVLQQIDGNIIGPRIMGGALNMNPILIIVSITIGGAYFGILGMFLAVPVAAILKIMTMNWLEHSKAAIPVDEPLK